MDGWISACTIDIFCVSVCDVALMFQFHVVCVCSNGTFRWGRTVALKRDLWGHGWGWVAERLFVVTCMKAASKDGFDE